MSILSFAVDDIFDAVYLIDQGGYFKYVNKEACLMLGYSHNDLLNSHISEIDQSLDSEKWANLWNILKEKKTTILFSYNKTKTASIIPVKITAKYIVFKKVEFVIAFIKNIPEPLESEKKTNKYEEMYKRIIETSNDGIVVIKPDSQATFANQKMTEILGYSTSEILALPITDFLVPEDIDSHNLKISNRKEKVSETYERKMRKKDGSIIWVLISATPMFDDQGEYIGSFAMFSDITERKKGEEYLKNINRIYLTLSEVNEAVVRAKTEESLLNTICEIIVKTGGYKLSAVAYTQNDEEKNFKIMSSFGKEADYFKQVKISWDENSPYGQGPAGRAVRSRQPQYVNSISDPNFKVWKETAETHGFSANISLPLIIQDQVIGVLAMYSDKENSFVESELKLIENLANNLAYGINSLRLKTQKDSMVNLLNEAQSIAHVGNWEIQLSNNDLTWSDELNRIFELDSSSSQSKYESFLNLIHSEDRERVHLVYANSLNNHQPYSMDYRVLLRDGKVKIVHEEGRIFYDENNNPSRSVGTIQDITEIKQIQNEIQQVNQNLELIVAERTNQLEKINKELQSFSYTVSHDLRVPLNHINSYLELLKKIALLKLDNEEQNIIINISKLSKQMGEIIDDILAFSRLDYQTMVTGSVNLNNLIKGVIQDFEPDLLNRKVNWNIEKLPIIVGDKNLLRLVFMNLISNALKFTRKNEGADIKIGYFSSESEYTIYVQDNGVGFDMQFSDKLFNAFQRLHPSNKFEGTGIGLANVKKIISRHGGKIWAESTVGEGATFYFSLPK